MNLVKNAIQTDDHLKNNILYFFYEIVTQYSFSFIFKDILYIQPLVKRVSNGIPYQLHEVK